MVFGWCLGVGECVCGCMSVCVKLSGDFFYFCPNLKKALAINRVKMVTTQTVSSFFFVLFEFKYFFLMQHVFSG